MRASGSGRCSRSPGEPERSRWFYVPTDHGGLALAVCTPAQRQAALRLLATGLSPAGYHLVAAVMGHELCWHGWKTGSPTTTCRCTAPSPAGGSPRRRPASSAKITGPAAGTLHFAWAGSTEPRQPYYYRIQGPRLLVEYDNTHRDADHIHTVWRDPAGDFGRDLLAAHYAASHQST